MNIPLIALTTLLIMLNSNLAQSHGENKPGPNGGFIRMPGPYHTEIITENKYTLKVYLLDIEWKNPTVQNSSIEVLHIEKTTTPAKCEPKENFYLCIFPKTIDLTKKARLSVNSQRDGQKGIEVRYPLPLKLLTTHNENGGHH